MNLQQTLDQSAAWHLKQLQMLCPEGTRATIILRLGNTDEVMVLGDEPDVKAALFAAVRACNGVKDRSDSRQAAQQIVPNAAVQIGSATVLDTPPAPEDMFSDMNGGQIKIVGDMEQG